MPGTSECPGLALCIPTPSPGPTGLTPAEQATIAQLSELAAAALIIALLFALAVAASLALYAITRE